MYGAVIGDIVGSIYEAQNRKSKDFELFGPGCTFTDDTVCTVAVAAALLDGLDPAVSLRVWGGRYPDRGYGASFREWLRRPEMGPYRSWGTGAAMRAGPAGFLARDVDEAAALARHVTAVSHDHPEGIKGAAAVATAVRLALEGVPALELRAEIAARFGYDLSQSVDQIRPGYRFDPSCQGTVPQALTCALEATGYEDALRNAVSIGGDSDTIACIAGAVAEALFGIPDDILARGKSYLPPEMIDVLDRLYARRAARGAA